MVLAKVCNVGTGAKDCRVTWRLRRAGETAQSTMLKVTGWMCKAGSVDFCPPAVAQGYAWAFWFAVLACPNQQDPTRDLEYLVCLYTRLPTGVAATSSSLSRRWM